MLSMRTLAVAAVVLAGAVPAAAQTYHVARTATLGGEGGWDYLALDTAGHRLFITRGDRVMVVDPDSGRVLAEIPGLVGAHGVAFAHAQGRGFATSGRDSSVVMFDLATLAVQGRIPAAPGADAIMFDPASRRIFSFNHAAGSVTVIDPVAGTRVATIPIGGALEFGVSDHDGRVYVNVEDSSQIVEIDARAARVTRRWSVAPCQDPTGLAIDRAHRRLFAACGGNGLMAVVDTRSGRVVATVPIGQGADAARFDDATQLAFASNGDGSITVVHEDDPDHFTVAQTVPTRRGARTMELDPVTHRLYTVGAEYGPTPAPTADRPRPRPPMLPGTFALIVLEP